MDSPPPAWTPDLLIAPHEAPEKATRVRGMFNAIAPTYERINTLFSAGRDAAWRRKAVELARVTHEDEVLDIACGTGDFARAFLAARPRRVVGADFAHAMLHLAVMRSPDIGWCEADALQLPFADASFSIVSCAFGVRNFADLDAGLREMSRVLRPGGRAVILEFTRPRNRLFRFAYEAYCHRVMPPAAAWISGDRTGAYRYLPRSVVSFLDAAQMEDRLRRAGFAAVRAVPRTFGVVTIYVSPKR